MKPLKDTLCNKHSEPSEGVLLQQLSRHRGPVRGLDFNSLSPSLLASRADEGETYIWDTTKPTEPTHFPPLKMSSTAPTRKRGLGRGPTQIPKDHDNPNDRILLNIRPDPDTTDFADVKVVKCIAQLCLQNWPTSAITWVSTPLAHKEAVWQEFQKRYRWDEAQTGVIQTLFWQKCVIRTKDNIKKEREKALHNAEIDHPGQAEEYMHEYGPWWCSRDIWAGMCQQWRSEDWAKKGKTAAKNRSAGVSEGERAKGTYKGGSISQSQHFVRKESEGLNWLDVYVATRDDLPDAVHIAETYKQLMDERYPPDSHRPPIDQELWERASIVKKNFVKGQGQRRRPTFSASGSACTQSSQATHASYNPTGHTAADCVRAICRDPALLRELQEHLKALTPDELSDAVATTARQPDQSSAKHDEERSS